MMTMKSKLITGALLVLILFIGGIVTGYYRWGMNRDETPDYKDYLKDTLKYIASLERQNRELEKQLGAAGTAPQPAGEQKPSEEMKGAGGDEILQQKIKSLEEEKAALEIAMSSDKDLNQKNVEMMDQIQSLIQTKNSVEQENAELRSKIGTDRDLAAENQKLTERIQTLTSAKADLDQKITELQSGISQDQNLAATNQQLEAQIESCIEGRADLEKENTELQAVLSKNQTLIAENQKFKQTIESRVNEVNVLKTRLTEIRSMTQVQHASEAQSPEAKPEAAP